MNVPAKYLLGMDELKSVERKLSVIQQYISAGRSNELWAVSDAIIPRRSLQNWLRNPVKAKHATLVKHGMLDVLLAVLPPLHIAEKVDNYKFALAEMGENEGTQKRLRDYDGVYGIYHQIPPKLLDPKFVAIKFSKEPFFTSFVLRAKVEGGSADCDGYVFSKGNYIIMSGLSKYLNIFLVVRSVVEPAETPLKGMLTINDESRNQCLWSQVILVNRRSDVDRSKSRKDALKKGMSLAFHEV
ncbi:hypothetical protein DSM25558_4870 [Agrobacterium sp. DSM 25558]|uniref:hypothetical protein n=1 Tax=Agrobacterium sp. DSM 25558 TaxID=1907665 RepID=UPI0009725D4F|nr:hypothetical protein [Agrobacterium sp. DSM 25558]SCX30141.1 hypothetical protein DSM25558_4870 [Agrobacterium sp. DSM 25558]